MLFRLTDIPLAHRDHTLKQIRSHIVIQDQPSNKEIENQSIEQPKSQSLEEASHTSESQPSPEIKLESQQSQTCEQTPTQTQISEQTNTQSETSNCQSDTQTTEPNLQSQFQPQSASSPESTPSNAPQPEVEPSSPHSRFALKEIARVRTKITDEIESKLPDLQKRFVDHIQLLVLLKWRLFSKQTIKHTHQTINLIHRRLAYDAGLLDETLMRYLFSLDGIEGSSVEVRKHRKELVLRIKELIKICELMRKRVGRWDNWVKCLPPESEANVRNIETRIQEENKSDNKRNVKAPNSTKSFKKDDDECPSEPLIKDYSRPHSPRLSEHLRSPQARFYLVPRPRLRRIDPHFLQMETPFGVKLVAELRGLQQEDLTVRVLEECTLAVQGIMLLSPGVFGVFEKEFEVNSNEFELRKAHVRFDSASGVLQIVIPRVTRRQYHPFVRYNAYAPNNEECDCMSQVYPFVHPQSTPYHRQQTFLNPFHAEDFSHNHPTMSHLFSFW